VVATTILNTYSTSIPVYPYSIPKPVAFDYIFYGAVAAMVLIIAFALVAKNYTFGRNQNNGPPTT
jgi:hypothetical protein